MGAQQSSGRGDVPGTPQVAKTCYYDLLGVERLATDDEIKRAYRRKALELHPDRNFGNVEIATQRFAEVQSAYEILSDPQERAWYDSHRDAILSGQDGHDTDGQPATFRNVRLTTTEEIMGLIRKFNATVPFDDEPTGFFGISRETFEHLVLEEEAAAEFDDANMPDYPTFGSSDDDYESVVKPFYAAWAGFSTRKSFSWKDKYRLSDAPDRRVRRLMEKENKKLRDDAIRDFNDAVRFLVGFVRKRDPRYLPNTQTDAERQASLRSAAAAQAARSRAAHQEKFASHEVPQWAQSRPDDGPASDDFSETEEDSEVEILECVACNKTFKSENQLEAHERSKKHLKAIQQLRRQMQREGADLQLDDIGPTSVQDTQPDTQESSAGEASVCQDRRHGEAAGLSPRPAEIPELLAAEDSGASSNEDDYAPRSVVEKRIVSESSASANLNGSRNVEEQGLPEAAQALIIDESTASGRKIGKAKAKRERKAAARALQEDVHRCSVCNETYTSRTKLFNHIRDVGHAAPVLKQGSSNKKKKH